MLRILITFICEAIDDLYQKNAHFKKIFIRCIRLSMVSRNLQRCIVYGGERTLAVDYHHVCLCGKLDLLPVCCYLWFIIFPVRVYLWICSKNLCQSVILLWIITVLMCMRVTTVCLTLIVNIVYPLGSTPNISRKIFITWLNDIVCKNSKGTNSKTSAGENIEGCFESLTCSELSKVTAALTDYNGWNGACLQHNVSAGKMLVITGSESKMTVNQYSLGPFVWFRNVQYTAAD